HSAHRHRSEGFGLWSFEFAEPRSRCRTMKRTRRWLRILKGRKISLLPSPNLSVSVITILSRRTLSGLSQTQRPRLRFGIYQRITRTINSFYVSSNRYTRVFSWHLRHSAPASNTPRRNRRPPDISSAPRSLWPDCTELRATVSLPVRSPV